MFDLSGRRAVVTGGGKGIGKEIARALSEGGATVTVLGRDLAALQETASSLGNADAVQLDVTDIAAVEQVFGGLGEIDILVNNAGAAESAPFERTTMELWQRMFAVNVTGAFLCTQQVLHAMKSRGSGRIVNVASTASLKGYPYSAAYCAAKHALLGMTRSLALDLARTGVTVNAVCPGFADTDLLASSVRRIVDATGRTEAEARKELLRLNPQGRFITPEEVAAAVLWLCSDEARGVTGQAIAVAGGEVM